MPFIASYFHEQTQQRRWIGQPLRDNQWEVAFDPKDAHRFETEDQARLFARLRSKQIDEVAE